MDFREHRSALLFPVELVIDNEITIKKVQLNHAKTIFEIVDKNRINLSTKLDWVRFTKTQLDSERFVLSMLDLSNNNKEHVYSIFYHAKLVGLITLRVCESKGELGYWLDEQFCKLGIMTRTVKEFTNYIINNKIKNFIYIYCAVDNKASNAVAVRAGYSYVGIIKNGETINGVKLDQNIYAYGSS